ncbi:MerR family transcriptional regulator [Massilia sp. UBA6681]|uniref:MerR family transcriptional regulator n=1 Tax=Massilia sp. UBA6681 TaxID=1946839 RepID=UPI0025B8E25B|nr:MerR family transcriptional regulator [Massilia sp. UBA6681]
MATYAPDAQQLALHGAPLAEGHARLLTRQVAGNFITDLEIATRNFPESRGTVELDSSRTSCARKCRIMTMESTLGVGHAAKLLGLTAKTLQRWEREGRLVPDGAHRQYPPALYREPAARGVGE